MAKKKSSKLRSSKPMPVISNQGDKDFKSFTAGIKSDEAFRNGLADVLGIGGGFGNFGYPENQGSVFSEQISQTTSLYKNLRWYFISNKRQVLSQSYVELGLVQTIIDVPIDDGLRGGVEIKSKQLSNEQIEELQISVDRDDDLTTLGQAGKWNRLYGGAGVLILTDQDPESPLDLEAIGPNTPLEFRAVDMWELFWDKQNTEGYDPTIQTHDFEFYSYYSEPVHKSRVMRLKGLTAPSFLRPQLRGWGFSVVEIMMRSLNQYLKATDLTYEVLDEFKLDIYKIRNFTDSLMSPIAEQNIKRRVDLANYQKNYQHALMMDAEDDYVQKQLSFAGLAETMAGIRIQLASDLRMPLTKLFGVSSAGFNSGEDDIEVYNAMVESQVRNKLKYDILRMLEIKCQKLFQFVPDDLSIQFKPLRVLSAEQEQNVKNAKFTRLKSLLDSGQVSWEDFANASNKGDLFDIQLDPSQQMLNPNAYGVVKEGADDPAKPQSVADPGANREDTRKPKAWDYGGIGTDIEKTPPPARQAFNGAVPGRNLMTTPGKTRNAVEGLSQNSLDFDKVSYEANGGDAWIDSREAPMYETMPLGGMPGLWAAAKEIGQKIYGKPKWQFTLWKYGQLGGTFK